MAILGVARDRAAVERLANAINEKDADGEPGLNMDEFRDFAITNGLRPAELRKTAAKGSSDLLAVETVEEVPNMIRRLQADPAYARAIAKAGQERMAAMDTDEVAHYCYEMLKVYAASQRFVPKRDPRSWEVNCEDDLVRHYDRGTMLQERYLVEDNSSCLRPPAPGAPLHAPGWGGDYAGTHPPCLASHDLSAPAEVGVCTKGTPQYAGSGRLDGPDWDVPEAYKGGALPDWSDADPAITGKGARTIPYKPA